MQHTELWNLARAHRAELIDLAQRLVRTPSHSGQEADVAAVLQAEMHSLGYDAVWVDAAGNVIGRIDGGGGASLMLNGHMDHVDAGDPSHWLHPPFGGEIHEGELWGRGTVDMKSALAAMVVAGGLIRELDSPLPGDLYVSAVVQEEVGGLGARHLARAVPVDRVVVGEASGNHLRRGHRGRMELHARFEGRSVHASMPELGINPHFSMARFLASLQGLEMASDPVYGSSTVAPTRVSARPDSANVTPTTLDLVLDWRNIPSEGPHEVVTKLSDLLADGLLAGCTGSIEISTKELTSYTGLQMAYLDLFPSFTTPAQHAWLRDVQALLEGALDRTIETDIWRFATDGGHFAEAGATVIGFGPGDDAVVHTTGERVAVDDLVESVVGYLALSLA